MPKAKRNRKARGASAPQTCPHCGRTLVQAIGQLVCEVDIMVTHILRRR